MTVPDKQWSSYKGCGHMWLLWEEEIAPEKWLVCFKPSEGSIANKFWVNVYKCKWSSADHNGLGETCLEEYRLEDELMLVCVMHEMREKYRVKEEVAP